MGRGRRERTMKAHGVNWKKWSGWASHHQVKVWEPTTFEVVQFLGSMCLESSPSGVDKIMTTLSVMMGKWWQENMADDFHIKLLKDGIRLEKTERVVTKTPLTWSVVSKILKFFSSIKLRAIDVRGAAFLGLSYVTAARPEEVASLVYGQCEFRDGQDKFIDRLNFLSAGKLLNPQFKLRVYFKGKPEKFVKNPHVAIPLGNVVASWLYSWLQLAESREEMDDVTAPVFTAMGGKWGNSVSEESFQAWWKVKKAQLYDNHIIDRETALYGNICCLRSGCITDMHNLGVPLAVSMRIARHKTPSVNLAYNKTLSFAGASAVQTIISSHK